MIIDVTCFIQTALILPAIPNKTKRPFLPSSKCPLEFKTTHHLEMFLISTLWILGLCLLLESFLLDNREVSYPPEHCCSVRKTMFFSNAISSFITTLRRVEIKQVKSALVVYLLPSLQKGLTVSTHTWTLMRPLVLFCTVFKTHCLLYSYCASEPSDEVCLKCS